MESVKQFLHQLNAKIEIPELGDLPPLRKNDSPIMQQSFTSSFPISSLQMINACRMYLQVHSLAEITHHSGNTLFECALFGTCVYNDQPILWRTSTSTIGWPNQQNTPRRTWKAWTQYQSLCLNKNQQLVTPLGSWTQYTHSRRNWKYLSNPTDETRIISSDGFMFEAMETRSRHTNHYKKTTVTNNFYTIGTIPVILNTVTEDQITTKPIYTRTYDVPASNYKYIPYYSMHDGVVFPTDTNITCFISPSSKPPFWYGSIYINKKHVIINQLDPIHVNNPTSHTFSLVLVCSLLQSLHRIINDTSTYTLHIHIKNRSTTQLLKRSLTTFSPNQCIRNDWDLLQLCQIQQQKYQRVVFPYEKESFHQLLSSLEYIQFRPDANQSIATTYPYLKINQKSVINNISSAIRKHSRESDIRQYLCAKNEW